jgi:hypothetical protein
VVVQVFEGFDGPVGGVDGRREDERLLLVDGAMDGHFGRLAILKIFGKQECQ